MSKSDKASAEKKLMKIWKIQSKIHILLRFLVVGCWQHRMRPFHQLCSGKFPIYKKNQCNLELLYPINPSISIHIIKTIIKRNRYFKFSLENIYQINFKKFINNFSIRKRNFFFIEKDHSSFFFLLSTGVKQVHSF